VLREEGPSASPAKGRRPQWRQARSLGAPGPASPGPPPAARRGTEGPTGLESASQKRGNWSSEEARARALRLVEASPGEAPPRQASTESEARRRPQRAKEPSQPLPELGTGPNDSRFSSKLAEAVKAYEADRYPEALRVLRKLASQAPTAAGVRELLGLTLYRMGRWLQAVRELQVYHQLSGSYDQFPVVADCLRAVRRYAEADEVWLQLRRASPSAEVMAEGRIVAAGSLADRGELAAAIELLQPSLRKARPRSHHLRQWYALADLYERAGEVRRARELFGRVAAVDPDAYDTRQRLSALA
jgi:tetratricopeptide (TPR) repeat protein